MANKNLFLIVTKEWYDKIASGEKRVEYREATPYWKRRIWSFPGFHCEYTVEFQCGYSRKYKRLKFNIIKMSTMLTPEEVKNTVKTEYCYAIYFK